ncbi:MAG: nucleotide disphospho-sugar-binding domain-containing protein [Acidobacteriota bacterium]
MLPLVILATSGTAGDIRPFITLGRGLLQRGHRVMMVVPRFHEALVRASALPCQTFGTFEEWQALLDDPQLWDERKGWGVIWKGLVPHLGAIRETVQSLPADQPCVVLCHPILVPMAALARSVRPDLRVVCAYLAPSNLCSSHDMLTAGSLAIPSWTPTAWRRALWSLIHKGWIDPVTLPSLNAARQQNQLAPVPHFFEHMLTAPDASLGLFPSWFAAAQTDWPQSFVEGDFVCDAPKEPQALSPALAQFLAEGPPPIVFTPGTGHQHAQRYFEIALKTLNRLGRRGVFVTPYKAQLPASLPSSVMWQAHAPFSALLPKAAAVVHHGGIGTMVDGFRAGVPQLIVPFAYDQFDNALRARRLGVAEVLQARRLATWRMNRQLARLLASPDVRRSCESLARTMAQSPTWPGLLDRIQSALVGDAPPLSLTGARS